MLRFHGRPGRGIISKVSMEILLLPMKAASQVETRGFTNWTELDGARLLTQIRVGQEKSRGDSFETISSSGSNAALNHYAPTEETNAPINQSAVYLGKTIIVL